MLRPPDESTLWKQSEIVQLHAALAMTVFALELVVAAEDDGQGRRTADVALNLLRRKHPLARTHMTSTDAKE